MADEGTLATTAQVLLAIGKNAGTDQISETNTNIWILMAESDIEKAFRGGLEIVTNFGSVTASYKQWIAMVASHRAAFYACNQNQQAWSLSVTQSKLAVIDSIWTGFLSDLKEDRANIIQRMGLTVT